MKLLFLIFCAAAILAAAAFSVLAMVKRRKNYIVSALLCALIAGIAAVGYATAQPVVKDDRPSAVHITRSPTDGVEASTVSPDGKSPSEAVQGAYTASSKAEKFHLPSCSAAGRISDENRVWFDTRDEAIAEGYSPCSMCEP